MQQSKESKRTRGQENREQEKKRPETHDDYVGTRETRKLNALQKKKARQ